MTLLNNGRQQTPVRHGATAAGRAKLPFSDSLLTRPVRRGFMIFLMMIFAISAPLLILYTAGYRYDVGSGAVRETGVVSIDIKPRDAAVTLGGVRINKSIPLRLTNRAPGTYHLKIEAPGYKTWEKDITVESKQTTYIRDVTLFREALPVSVVEDTSGVITQVLFSSDGAYALIVKKEKPSLYTISLLTTATGAIEEGLVAIETVTPPLLSWSSYSSMAFVSYKEKNGTALVLVTPEGTKHTTDTEHFSGELPAYQWGESTIQPSLIYQIGTTLIEKTGFTKGTIAKNITSTLWYVENGGTVWQGREKTISNGRETYATKNKVTHILHINNTRMIGQTDNGYDIIPRDTAKDGETIEGTSATYETGTGEWLLYTPWQLTTVYPTGEHEVLNRTSDAIETVIQLDSFGLLLLATEHSLLGFNPGYYITHPLFGDGDIYSTGANEAARQIYFFGTVGNKKGIFSLQY